MNAVEVTSLRKTFGELVAVDRVGFTVEPGEVFGILGPNGAGKSTTVECLTGAITPDAGMVRVLGVDPAADRATVREKVGYQLQSAVLPAALRVEEAMRLYASFYANPQPIGELLEAVGLREHRRRPFGKLSGGQQQRLSIALALIGSPEVVVLDELTTGLDPQARREVWALVERVKARGVTVILVSHSLDEVERLCDRLTIIAAGRTKFIGTPAELRGDARTLEDAYVTYLDAHDRSDRA
ncbi:ABC transporter ATP-binding protein [Agromyces archimandritae]|uniref:ABC transporter ATP-binding protein n=1 Tax=Agromyces archimandritae TaxID=2781962 RepID=A0A975FP66_9MICO|nr:ABC transporter ATP-binding protein [Agromyces archimandritae]QTX06048.1 ABC transporter ATP-binding protein [Agromyces archimandritae]